MKRRVLFLVVAICLLFSVATGSTKLVSAATEASLPKVGDEIDGFKVLKLRYDSSTKSRKILFEHEGTGAKILVINNNDINRGFSIKFNTAPDNDKGINHIIEHSVLGGSKKYPSNNVIFDVSNTTYVSYVNAFTYPNMTVYPVCSKSEEQLLKSADIYLDTVFNPLLLSDKRIFEREGWRYELNDVSANLTYNGIVYNEMQGSLGSIESTAFSNAKKAIFPDSDQGNISGGDPSDIINLTYEELVETYKKNYHPSNSLMVLYGDVDYKAFLKMIEEDYLSSYNKKTYSINRNTQKSFGKLVEKSYSFPVAEGADTKNKSIIDLVFATSDITKVGMQNYVELNIAVSLLNLESSTLKQALLESNIAESYRITMDGSTFQPTIHFMAVNADETKKNDFYKLVMKKLKEIVAEGLDTELVKSSLRSLKFEEAIGSTDGSAINALVNASYYDNLVGSSLVDYTSYYETIVTNLDQKIIEKEIEEQIINNTLVALTVTIPDAGLLEENQKKIEKALADKKASMTKKQLNALAKKTTEFNTWNSQETSDEVLKSLRAVSLKDISVDIKDRTIEETTVDGAKLLSATADVASVGAVKLSFDLSHLTKEELLYLKFYSDMLSGAMATANRSEMQVLNETALKAYQMSTSVTTNMKDKKDTSAYPAFSINYYGFTQESTDTFELVSDILLNSDVANIETYGTRTISNLKANYQNHFANPISLALYRSMAYTSQTYRIYNYFYGLDYYNFILALEKQLAISPADVVKNLEKVRTKAFNKSNLTVLFAGDTSAQQSIKTTLPIFTNKLSNETYVKATYTLPIPAKREAMTINSTVQYVCVNASLTDNNVPQGGKLSVINNILNNLLLTPEIRLKGGAYGATALSDFNNYVAYTYRDSNYINSMATIGATDEFLKTISPYMTEDTLESYKLSAYAAASPSSNEMTDALSALQSKAQGFTTQDRVDTLTQIKETTIADIDSYAEYMAKINSNMNYVIIASPADIEAHKDLFDNIIPLQ